MLLEARREDFVFGRALRNQETAPGQGQFVGTFEAALAPGSMNTGLELWLIMRELPVLELETSVYHRVLCDNAGRLLEAWGP